MTAGPPRDTDPDPFGAVTADRRHAVYADLARRGPVHRITTPAGTPAWLVTGYDEARQVLNDRRITKGPMLHGPLAAALRPEVSDGLYPNLLLNGWTSLPVVLGREPDPSHAVDHPGQLAVQQVRPRPQRRQVHRVPVEGDVLR